MASLTEDEEGGTGGGGVEGEGGGGGGGEEPRSKTLVGAPSVDSQLAKASLADFNFI